jgi:hypothetical protein
LITSTWLKGSELCFDPYLSAVAYPVIPYHSYWYRNPALYDWADKDPIVSLIAKRRCSNPSCRKQEEKACAFNMCQGCKEAVCEHALWFPWPETFPLTLVVTHLMDPIDCGVACQVNKGMAFNLKLTSIANDLSQSEHWRLPRETGHKKGIYCANRVHFYL